MSRNKQVKIRLRLLCIATKLTHRICRLKKYLGYTEMWRDKYWVLGSKEYKRANKRKDIIQSTFSLLNDRQRRL